MVALLGVHDVLALINYKIAGSYTVFFSEDNIMDTDDLSELAYECIIYANEATDILKTELGAECSKHTNEDDYLKAIESYVAAIKDEPDEYLENWCLEEDVDKKQFLISIDLLLKKIEKTINIARAER